MAPKKPKDAITPFIINPDRFGSEQAASTAKDELQLKIIDEIFSKEDIQLKTDLSPNQIIAFARAKMYYEIYGVEIVDSLLQSVSEWLISKDRKSRKEFVEIAKALHVGRDDLEDEIKPFGRLIGKEKL